MGRGNERLVRGDREETGRWVPQRKFLGAYVTGGVLRREERERERERGDSKCERLRSAGNLSASKIARPTTAAPTSRGPLPGAVDLVSRSTEASG
ncbi:hypothetical protein BHE74_00011209 [Ensete ventricosum]|nr:hypothetical protein BHE74_00011209 [Ensete ventricosum]